MCSDDEIVSGTRKRSPTSSLQDIPEEDKTDCVTAENSDKTTKKPTEKTREDTFRRQSSFDRRTFDSEDTVSQTSRDRDDASGSASKKDAIQERDIHVNVEIKSPNKPSMPRRERKL